MIRLNKPPPSRRFCPKRGFIPAFFPFQGLSVLQGGWNYPERNYPESVGIIRKALELSGKKFAFGQNWNYPEKNLNLPLSKKLLVTTKTYFRTKFY